MEKRGAQSKCKFTMNEHNFIARLAKLEAELKAKDQLIQEESQMLNAKDKDNQWQSKGDRV
eukprot:3552250-Ditylum_brightwellii.AAC.1